MDASWHEFLTTGKGGILSTAIKRSFDEAGITLQAYTYAIKSKGVIVMSGNTFVLIVILLLILLFVLLSVGPLVAFV
jgi:hypothetical protein